MDNFIYETPTKVYFGAGEESKVGKLVAAFAPKKVLIHYGGQSAEKSGLLNKVRESLRAENIDFVELGGVQPNPVLSLVRRGIELCRAEGVDFILAVGGGSVMDSSKDIANGVANPEVDVWDFSLGKATPAKTLHKGCILTLAAAGSEMSNSCVITREETQEKRGYGCSANRFDFAIEDPELTYSVSKYQTACGAVDIAMHTMERFFCPGSDTYVTDNIALAVIKSALRAGKDAYKAPDDYVARANMMWASSLAHNGLTQCGRTFQLMVHQLEHEISGMYPEVAHGAGLAALWCSWARYVCDANVPRFLQWATEVWGLETDPDNPMETVIRAIDLQEEYYKSIGMPIDIKALGVKPEDLPELALRCSRNKTRKVNGDRPLGYEDLLMIYCMAYERSGEKLRMRERVPEIRLTECPEGDGPLTVCIGDSITYGSGVSAHRREQAYPYILADMTEGSERFFNFGISGATLMRTADKPYPSCLLRYAQFLNPDRVMIMLGTNDTKAHNWNREEYEKSLRWALGELKSWDSLKEIVVMVPPWAYPQESASGILYGITEENMAEMIATIWANTEGVRVIDLFSLTRDHKELFADGVHLNTLGNQVCAKYIDQELNK